MARSRIVPAMEAAMVSLVFAALTSRYTSETFAPRMSDHRYGTPSCLIPDKHHQLQGSRLPNIRCLSQQHHRQGLGVSGFWPLHFVSKAPLNRHCGPICFGLCCITFAVLRRRNHIQRSLGRCSAEGRRRRAGRPRAEHVAIKTGRQGHDHDHEDHIHSHGHSHAHGHAHGEVPEWIPGASILQRIVNIARSRTVMISGALLYMLSLFPWVSYFPRMLGPFAVFTIFGFPQLLEILGSQWKVDIHVLMTVAAFASAVIGHAHEGALLLLLFALSEAVEESLSARAQASIESLSTLSPEIAHKVAPWVVTLGDSKGFADVPVSELSVGDRILVRAGEVVPVDGDVQDGVSQVGLQHLTGESAAKVVRRGDAVVSGAVNIDGALLLDVRRLANESTLQRIARLTASAKSARPRLVTVLDAVGERWASAVMLSTIVIGVVPPVFWHAPAGASLYRAIVWLITASPCALVLASPLVYVSALSVAAANGVLIKGGRTLDALSSTTGVAFDKTGTITTSVPVLRIIEEIGANADSSDDSASQEQALAVGAALGRLSVHPVSRAVAQAGAERNTTQNFEVTNFHMVAGGGVSGVVSQIGASSAEAFLGRPGFVAQRIESLGEQPTKVAAALLEAVTSLEDEDDESKAGGGILLAALAICHDNECRTWLFQFEDQLKSSAEQVLAEVSRENSIYMLTGDRYANALTIVNQLSEAVRFEGIHADLQPADKLARVTELDQSLRTVNARNDSMLSRCWRMLGVSVGGLVMVGDGVNDAPALAASSAGISLAAGGEGALLTNAMEASDVVILHRASDHSGASDLIRVAWTLKLAKRVRRIVQQNLALALSSIVWTSGLALFKGVPLWLAVLVHEGTTVIVALNSLRLLRPIDVAV